MPELLPTNDRSSEVLAVQRLAPNDRAPSQILWSRDLALTHGTSRLGSAFLEAVGAGSLVHIAFDAASDCAASEVYYLVIDTSALP